MWWGGTGRWGLAGEERGQRGIGQAAMRGLWIGCLPGRSPSLPPHSQAAMSAGVLSRAGGGGQSRARSITHGRLVVPRSGLAKGWAGCKPSARV